ncbi:actin-domain-containing protein [Fistulina hepatica ATCC 64428]|uniref:Actin-like protein ARP6 n=1 Tax=Fistulina hepatica ATCC 64428 TaxID=1128425 RepID=A0A0D7AI18_9AGAR|nr:actin-domain-containing protein [Fistulina hepatica ATCC 64428]
MSNPIVILDNGGQTVKAGIFGIHPQPKIIPNVVVRSKGDKATYIGQEIEKCEHYSSLRYRLPFEKGFVVDWDVQKAIWDNIFSEDILNIDTTESSVLITEPYFNLPNIQDVYDQFIFEEYEFRSCHRNTAAALIQYGPLFQQPGLPTAECFVLVDSGFSFTHVVPVLNGKAVWNAVKRIDVGGKLLTNQLKELVSYRQWNMMDETHIINHAKETCCFVSLDFKSDIETCRLPANPILREYILPDLTVNRYGKLRLPGDTPNNDQILVMNNERFSVPEIIFRPSDIGLNQAGLAETIAHSISLLPADLQGMFWANIGLVGGNTKFPHFRERLMSELQSLAPADVEIILYESSDPITETYHSAYVFASLADFQRYTVTRAEYLEIGCDAARRKFAGWDWYAEVAAVMGESGRRNGPGRRRRRRTQTTSTQDGNEDEDGGGDEEESDDEDEETSEDEDTPSTPRPSTRGRGRGGRRRAGALVAGRSSWGRGTVTRGHGSVDTTESASTRGRGRRGRGQRATERRPS